MIKRISMIIIGIILVNVSLLPMSFATDWVTPNITDFNITNETQNANETLRPIDELKDRISELPIENWFKGTLGFVFMISSLAFIGFKSIAAYFNVTEPYLSGIGYGAAFLLFIALIFSLGLGIAKLTKVAMRYALLIAAIVVILSLFFGFLAGV